ncbi:MAG TPA: hypothetical protein VE287_07820 [Actinopolymorphaceae bacterium]|nr:hypothetical protein [Actinopolymorphaceae bacterium]
MTPEEIVQRLTDARLSSYAPAILTWQGRRHVRGRLESETRSMLARTTDEHAGRQLMRHFPTQGVTDPDAYRDALLQLPDGSVALTALRAAAAECRPGRRCRPDVEANPS